MAILLGIIQQRPVNAYEITKWLSRLNVTSWYHIADSTVYATIKAAEKRGYISGTVEKSGNMPGKTVFSITLSGKKEFITTIENFICNFDYDITPFSISIFFINALERNRAVSLLEQRIDLLNKYQQGIETQVTKMKFQNIPDVFIGNTMQNLYIIEAQLKGATGLLPQIIVMGNKNN